MGSKQEKRLSPERLQEIRDQWKDSTSDELLAEIDALRGENERLKKIIAKQLFEEDGLGYEFTYVICLKEENEKLQQLNNDSVAEFCKKITALEKQNGNLCAKIGSLNLDNDGLWIRNHEFEERIEKLRAPLKFIIENENQAFAECSIAEEIWGKCADAIAQDDVYSKPSTINDGGAG